jgi:2-desacetyl-2-hydroxyethyl bacteriochlorophyllide A dehydrogenase
MSSRRVVTFTAPRTVDVRNEPIPEPGPSAVRVQTEVSAISPGTEGLIYRDEAPAGMAADASIEALSGGLDYPITYGYAAVGRVEAVGADVDPGWEGQRVFAFQPHASHFVAAPDALIPLPDDVSNEDAVMIPNVETAVNLMMDGRPMIGERVVVFGQGVVGLLTTALASRHPVAALYAVEPHAERRHRAEKWGSDRCLDPSDVDTLKELLHVTSADPQDAREGRYEGADLAIELSGKPDVLNDAISVTGFDGRILVGSWYGAKSADIDLGGRYHRSRMEITSSQVSSIDPRHRGRWSKERRMQAVIDLLPDVRPGRLISDVFSVEEAPHAYEQLFGSGEPLLQPVFRYDV